MPHEHSSTIRKVVLNPSKVNEPLISETSHAGQFSSFVLGEAEVTVHRLSVRRRPFCAISETGIRRGDTPRRTTRMLRKVA